MKTRRSSEIIQNEDEITISSTIKSTVKIKQIPKEYPSEEDEELLIHPLSSQREVSSNKRSQLSESTDVSIELNSQDTEEKEKTTDF